MTGANSETTLIADPLSADTQSHEPNMLREDMLLFALEQDNFADYRIAERIVTNLKAQGKTISGAPKIRPSDCALAREALEKIFERNRAFFRTGDDRFIDRFEALVAEFYEFCVAIYPSEAMSALILHARVQLFMGNTDRVIDMVGHFATRPYLIESGFWQAKDIGVLYGQAHLQRGTLCESGMSFLSMARWLIRVARFQPHDVGIAFAPFIAASAGPSEKKGLVARLIVKASSRYVHGRRGYGNWFYNRLNLHRLRLWGLLLSILHRVQARSGGPVSPHSETGTTRPGPTLVTRAQGGIGDLIMMTPGLRALAKRQGRPVDFALPQKFHAIFRNNPYVRLLDIEGPPIDISAYAVWANLSICPAGRYESTHRPHVKKGRVELFARGMGVLMPELSKTGMTVDIFLSESDREFCARFKAENGLGQRAIIGIQPYSRDSYKDHLRISDTIRKLSETYDIVIFHHVKDGLPTGEGIVSTAGNSLGNSLALVSILDGMVSVDSAFLHAAAAFDVPVVALFGPTDGRTFTLHHKKVKILWKPQSFPCIPCWRNEDMECAITRQTGASPCINAITADDVLSSVRQVLALNRQQIEVAA